ncbi:MAG TPA: hypothetical protein VK612_07645 [Pyrinomonadaceae bacterium]|nr:hypothetical protein [Pyrinomonadaceae bacterium]
MKLVYSVIFLLILSLAALAQGVPAGYDLSNYGVRIEPDERVMVVMATLEAARTTNDAGESVPVINTPLSSQGQKFRDLLKSDLAALNEDLRTKISAFVLAHKRRNAGKSDAELVSSFVSMAYALTAAPELADPIVTSDLPGTLLDVLDFAPLVRDFYRRSSFAGNLPDYIKEYQAASDIKLRPSAREMVSDLLTYLNTKPQLFFAERIKTETQKTKKTTLQNIETRERERHFSIVPEMLAPTGTINFVNIKDDYYVVLSPDTDLVLSDVRRGFLQFVVDPIVIKNNKDISSIRESVKKILDERRAINPAISPDVYLTISRSLVAAIDAKQLENLKNRIATDQARAKIAQMGGSDPTKQIAQELDKLKQQHSDETILRLSEDFEKGAILDFYFAEQLKGMEQSGSDIAAAMREMILSFDPVKETGRYEAYADARKRAIAVREDRKKNPTATTVITDNPVTARLNEIRKTVDAKDYTKAESDLKQLLAANPTEARIYYNLGRVSSLSAESIEDQEKQTAKLLESKVAYENVVRISQKQQVDPALLSLSYVALAKIYEFYDNRSLASALYDSAIKIGDVSGGAFQEAMASKQRLIKNP